MTDKAFECPRCAKRGKTWEGSDPKCGFTRDGKFITGNWNCATLNDLRNLDTAEFKRIYCDDETMKVIPISGVDFADDCNPMFLILCWYKSRGRMPFARILFTDYEEKDITAEQAEAILAWAGCRP